MINKVNFLINCVHLCLSQGLCELLQLFANYNLCSECTSHSLQNICLFCIWLL